ncbi:hypothetical protein ILUMI_19679 [Ignelater luminosus]|uniref:Uncharacterized protein n=1 Tax=Ignelater luminosus TaxID=2038154 RepID=A0A8K0CFQ9_IGNLU|nr:hypothetical protein ILUMI_19679 [Ignelater luminosus]
MVRTYLWKTQEIDEQKTKDTVIDILQNTQSGEKVQAIWLLIDSDLSVMERFHFRAHAVYNLDESGVTTVLRVQTVIAQRGRKQIAASGCPLESGTPQNASRAGPSSSTKTFDPLLPSTKDTAVAVYSPDDMRPLPKAVPKHLAHQVEEEDDL